MGFGKWIGAINPTTWLSTGAQIAGDYIGAKQAGKDADSAREANMFMSEEDRKFQREMAQNGIRWRVEDARAAGVHPMYALGANTSSGSPTSIPVGVDNSRADFFSRTGQNISRAISATQTQNERLRDRLVLEGAALDNEYKRVLIDNARPGPAFPGTDGNFMDSQGDSGTLMNNVPVKRNVSQPGRYAQEAGWRPDVSYSRSDTGLVPVIPEGLSESMEDDMIGKIMWRIRNQFSQNFDSKTGKPPKSQLPSGYVDWYWSRSKQEWQPTKSHNLKFNWFRGDFLPNGGK